jgi:hypothetical protein
LESFVSGSGSRQYLAQFSNNKKCVQNLAISMSEAALFPKNLASHFFTILTFLFHFLLDPDPNPAPVPLRQKVAVPIPQQRKRKKGQD